MVDVDPLFKPLRVKSLQLANRIVMAPMGRRGATGGVLSPDYAPYYRRRAEGGVGLILGEATLIGDTVAGNTPFDSRFHGKEALDAWRHVTDQVHAGGARFMPQLWHVGGVGREGADDLSRTPSGLAIPAAQGVEQRAAAQRVGEPMTPAEIDAIIAGYVEAAGKAKDMGADGVELHAAHGYLLDQFFWRALNHRADRFGGDIRGRSRFACEVVRAIRERVGTEFPIQLRFSQWKLQDYQAQLFSTPAELEIFVTALAEAGVDIFHCSQRRFWDAEFAGSGLNLAGWTKKLSGAFTVTVGSVGLDTDYFVDIAEQMKSRIAGSSDAGAGGGSRPGHAAPHSVDRLVEKLDAGEFDLVALGRMLIANPDWPTLIRNGQVDAIRHYDRTLLSHIA
jgi:2,4-dienoyl-CoA reductase-like NADH-dependent reductase (Old Yellow Enzyme family)